MKKDIIMINNAIARRLFPFKLQYQYNVLDKNDIVSSIKKDVWFSNGNDFIFPEIPYTDTEVERCIEEILEYDI